MRKVIIIGATSGIGRALVQLFSAQGFEVGLMGRREALLQEIMRELPGKAYAKAVDISETAVAIERLNELLNEMGRVDVIVVSAGVGFINDGLEWLPERETIATNVCGLAAVCNTAMNFFAKQGTGQLAAISSIAAIRGNSSAPAYAASKAFVSNYLEGLRGWAYKKNLPITVTEIQPGFVDTAMAQGDGLFWVEPVEKAARLIYRAICMKRSHVYVSGRWRLIAWLLRSLPWSIFKRMA